MKRVILILMDGMRPDSLPACGNGKIEEILKHSRYTMEGRTVMPSVTLPCHMSLFHSVDPGRHGILTNTYVPQVRPVNGLCEVLHAAGKPCAFFFNWEELRDLARPGMLAESHYISGRAFGYDAAGERLTDAAVDYLRRTPEGFTFLYLGSPDHAGHASGWMGEAYLRAVRACWDCAARVLEQTDGEDLVIITADHGGHGRSHGTDLAEDMTIPVIFHNPGFRQEKLESASILDYAPTVASALGVAPDGEWEGSVLPVF